MSQPVTQGVPFLDLELQHRGVRAEIAQDVETILDSSAFINGPQVAAFEAAFADYCHGEHCVGMASGLDALRLALVCAGVAPGDEVIVPAMTFIATWEAVSQVGAVPVPVDVDAADFGLDPSALVAATTQRTSAVVTVHLYGQMADLRAILRVSEERGLAVIQDAAQAHGAERDGVRAGAVGHSAFSFYPGKNLGAIGDAGAIVTSDGDLARRARALREHGQERKYHHDEIGWTARLDTIQAAALLRKLPYLDGWNEQRRAVAAQYSAELRDVGDLVLPETATDSVHSWHVYVVRTSDPEGLAAHLRPRGIGTGRHYPEPPHLSAAYAHLDYGVGAFPVAEGVASECLSLPLFPGMTETQVELVVEGIRSWFGGG
jgi:dTDP-4-amino-4,6-dideoxygalactose transaminase